MGVANVKPGNLSDYTQIITTDSSAIRLIMRIIYLLVNLSINQGLRILLYASSVFGHTNFNIYISSLLGLVNAEISFRIARAIYQSRFQTESSIETEDLHLIRQFYLFWLNVFFSVLFNMIFFVVYFLINNFLLRKV